MKQFFWILSVFAVVAAVGGIVYLLRLAIERKSSNLGKWLFLFVAVLVTSLIVVMVSYKGLPAHNVLALEWLHAAAIWSTVLLVITFNRLINAAHVRHKDYADALEDSSNKTRAIDAAEVRFNSMQEELEVRLAQRTQELREIANNLHVQIRERKFIENELLNCQRQYNTLAHNYPNGLIGILNKELRYVLVDGKELDRLQMKVEQLIGHKIFEANPEFIKFYERQLVKAFEGEKVIVDVELSGSIYNVIAVPLPDIENEQVNEILVIISNITQWRKLQDDLHRAIAQEKELVELKSGFLTMASHEFRTPLGTILSSVFLLERYNDGDYQDKRTIHINRIRKTVNHLTEVLNDFLSLGKVEDGRIRVVPKPTNIEECIEETVKEMRTLKKLEQRVEYTPSGINRVVMIDSHLLHNIIMNLISNAIKYSPVRGAVTVLSELRQDQLVVSVVDQGFGIPEEDQPHIFERFFRSRNATSAEGTGLGLHIVKKYVELMRGSIDFSSNENGTTFRVSIPVE